MKYLKIERSYYMPKLVQSKKKKKTKMELEKSQMELEKSQAKFET